jgi:acetoin utilization deacetylase AcuC-like enzyme
MIPVFYHPGFAAPIGEKHIMPMRKFALVAERLRDDPRARFHDPDPIAKVDLARVHTPDYIRAITTGEPRDLAESQKFPWSPALYPAVALTNGGLLAAARAALDHGVAACLASGFHHAHSDHGEGFCTFNGLVVTLDTLLAEGRILRGAVLDLDLHYGNGTAQLAATRPAITAISIYGSDYWGNQAFNDLSVSRHSDGPNHLGIPIPNASRGPAFLELLERSLPLLLAGGKPDLLLYQAGADPFREDPYSPLDLDHEDLRARDVRVFQFCHDHAIPVAWVLAGGYTHDVNQVVQVHLNTFEACAGVYSS